MKNGTDVYFKLNALEHMDYIATKLNINEDWF